MFQIFNSVTATCMKYGHDYLPYVVAVTVLFMAGGLALRLISRR